MIVGGVEHAGHRDLRRLGQPQVLGVRRENEVLHVGEVGATAQVYVEAGELRVDRARIVSENNHLWLIVFAHALDVHAVLAGSMHALMPRGRQPLPPSDGRGALVMSDKPRPVCPRSLQFAGWRLEVRRSASSTSSTAWTTAPRASSWP